MRIILLLLSFLFFISACERVPDTEVTEKLFNTFSVSDSAVLHIDNLNGSVTINGWEQDHVELTAIKKAPTEELLNEIEIVITQTEEFRIETHYPRKSRTNMAVAYTLFVPKNLHIAKIEMKNGVIEIHDARGDAELKSTNGSISVSDFEGKIEAVNTNGSILIDNVIGTVSARNTNGNIRLSDIDNLQFAHTTNGKLFADVNYLNEMMKLTNSNGAITLYLPKQIDATLKARCSNGVVKVENLDLIGERATYYEIEGYLGRRTHLVSVSTANGKIEIIGKNEQIDNDE